MPSSIASSGPLTSPAPSLSPPPDPPPTHQAAVDTDSELSELTDDEQEQHNLDDEDGDQRRRGRSRSGKAKRGIVPPGMWDWAYRKNSKSNSEEKAKEPEEEEEEEPLGASKPMEEEEEEEEEEQIIEDEPAGDVDSKIVPDTERDVDADVAVAVDGDVDATSGSEDGEDDDDGADDDDMGSAKVSGKDGSPELTDDAEDEEDEDDGDLDEDTRPVDDADADSVIESESDGADDDIHNPADDVIVHAEKIITTLVTAASPTLPLVAPLPLTAAASSIMAGSSILKTPTPSPSPSPEPENENEATVDPDGDVDMAEADVEVAEVEETEVELQPAHRAEALDVLAAIELKFGLLRERLYIEKMEDLAREEALLLEDSHPELLHLHAELTKRRERRLELASGKRMYEIANITKRRRCDEDAVWSWWKHEKESLQMEMLAETNRKRRKMERERRTLERPLPVRPIPHPPTSRDLPTTIPTFREVLDASHPSTRTSASSREAGRVHYPNLSSLSPPDIAEDLQLMFRQHHHQQQQQHLHQQHQQHRYAPESDLYAVNMNGVPMEPVYAPVSVPPFQQHGRGSQHQVQVTPHGRSPVTSSTQQQTRGIHPTDPYVGAGPGLRRSTSPAWGGSGSSGAKSGMSVINMNGWANDGRRTGPKEMDEDARIRDRDKERDADRERERERERDERNFQMQQQQQHQQPRRSSSHHQQLHPAQGVPHQQLGPHHHHVHHHHVHHHHHPSTPLAPPVPGASSRVSSPRRIADLERQQAQTHPAPPDFESGPRQRSVPQLFTLSSSSSKRPASPSAYYDDLGPRERERGRERDRVQLQHISLSEVPPGPPSSSNLFNSPIPSPLQIQIQDTNKKMSSGFVMTPSQVMQGNFSSPGQHHGPMPLPPGHEHAPHMRRESWGEDHIHRDHHRPSSATLTLTSSAILPGPPTIAPQPQPHRHHRDREALSHSHPSSRQSPLGLSPPRRAPPSTPPLSTFPGPMHSPSRLPVHPPSHSHNHGHGHNHTPDMSTPQGPHAILPLAAKLTSSSSNTNGPYVAGSGPASHRPLASPPGTPAMNTNGVSGRSEPFQLSVHPSAPSMFTGSRSPHVRAEDSSPRIAAPPAKLAQMVDGP